MVEVMKIMAASFKRPHAHTATPSAPDPAAGHHRPSPLPENPGHSWTSLGQSLVGSLLLSPGSWCTQGSVCVLQESISPVLCKFWQLLVTSSKRVKPYPSLLHPEPLLCGSPLLTRTARGDTHAQSCPSLCVVSGSWCA